MGRGCNAASRWAPRMPLTVRLAGYGSPCARRTEPDQFDALPGEEGLDRGGEDAHHRSIRAKDGTGRQHTSQKIWVPLSGV